MINLAGMRFNDGIGKYQCTGSHDGSFAYYGMVEQGRPHPNQGIVVHTSSVKCHVVADGYVIAYFYG